MWWRIVRRWISNIERWRISFNLLRIFNMNEKITIILSIVGAIIITVFLQTYNYITDSYIISAISIVINYLILGTIITMTSKNWYLWYINIYKRYLLRFLMLFEDHKSGMRWRRGNRTWPYTAFIYWAAKLEVCFLPKFLPK